MNLPIAAPRRNPPLESRERAAYERIYIDADEHPIIGALTKGNVRRGGFVHLGVAAERHLATLARGRK